MNDTEPIYRPALRTKEYHSLVARMDKTFRVVFNPETFDYSLVTNDVQPLEDFEVFDFRMDALNKGANLLN